MEWIRLVFLYTILAVARGIAGEYSQESHGESIIYNNSLGDASLECQENVTCPPPQQTNVTWDVVPSIRVNLTNRCLEDYCKDYSEFQLTVAEMGNRFAEARNYTLSWQINPEHVLVRSVAQCYVNATACVQIEFGLPVNISSEEEGPQLSVSNLQAMWDMFASELPPDYENDTCKLPPPLQNIETIDVRLRTNTNLEAYCEDHSDFQVGVAEMVTVWQYNGTTDLNMDHNIRLVRKPWRRRLSYWSYKRADFKYRARDVPHNSPVRSFCHIKGPTGGPVFRYGTPSSIYLTSMVETSKDNVVVANLTECTTEVRVPCVRFTFGVILTDSMQLNSSVLQEMWDTLAPVLFPYAILESAQELSEWYIALIVMGAVLICLSIILCLLRKLAFRMKGLKNEKKRRKSQDSRMTIVDREEDSRRGVENIDPHSFQTLPSFFESEYPYYEPSLTAANQRSSVLEEPIDVNRESMFVLAERNQSDPVPHRPHSFA